MSIAKTLVNNKPLDCPQELPTAKLQSGVRESILPSFLDIPIHNSIHKNLRSYTNFVILGVPHGFVSR